MTLYGGTLMVTGFVVLAMWIYATAYALLAPTWTRGS